MGLFNLKLLRYLIDEIKKENPDIIHYNGLELIGFYLALASKIAGVKNRILAVHGSSLEARNYNFLKKNIINVYEMITIILSTKIYGVSDYVSNWKRLRYLNKKYVGTIYNISKNHGESEENINFKKENKINEDEIIIVSTGRINKEKGYDILLEVIRRLDLQLKKIKYKFLIVGSGEYLEEMKKESQKYKLESKIRFLGYREDIDRILKNSDIFVICTKHETLCMSILEASNNKLPVIAPKVGGIPEIIENGYNGFLIEPENILQYVEKLKLLIEKENLRLELGKNGYNKIKEKFLEKKILRQLDNLYKELLEKK